MATRKGTNLDRIMDKIDQEQLGKGQETVETTQEQLETTQETVESNTDPITYIVESVMNREDSGYIIGWKALQQKNPYLLQITLAMLTLNGDIITVGSNRVRYNRSYVVNKLRYELRNLLLFDKEQLKTILGALVDEVYQEESKNND